MYIHTLHTYIYTYINAYITYTHTYIYTYIVTYIHYIHTYINAYIHTYRNIYIELDEQLELVQGDALFFSYFQKNSLFYDI